MMSGPRRHFTVAVMLILTAAPTTWMHEARAQVIELDAGQLGNLGAVSYTHLRAHET